MSSLELQKAVEKEYEIIDENVKNISTTNSNLRSSIYITSNNILTQNEHLQGVIGLYQNLETVVEQLDLVIQDITDKPTWITNHDLADLEINFNEEILSLNETSSKEFDAMMKTYRNLEKHVEVLSSEMEIILGDVLSTKHDLTKIENHFKKEIRSLRVVLLFTIIGISVLTIVSPNYSVIYNEIINYLTLFGHYIIYGKKSVVYGQMDMARKLFVTYL